MQLLTCVSIYHKPGVLTFQDLRLQFLEYILHPLSVDNTLLNLILRFYRHFHTPEFPIERKQSQAQLPIKRASGNWNLLGLKKKKINTEAFSHQLPGIKGSNWPARVLFWF